MTDAGNPNNGTTDDSSSFEYKSSLLKDLFARNVTAVGGIAAHRIMSDVKTIVLLKSLSNFFRSLEMPLINCKIHLEVSWDRNCATSNIARATTLKITSTKLYVPIVTLSTKANVNLIKQLNKRFERSVY